MINYLLLAYNKIMKILTYILIIFSIFALWLASYNVYTSLTHPLKFRQEIVLYAKTYDLNPAIIASIINVESSFNKNAKSSKNAIGLMQIKLETANYLNALNKSSFSCRLPYLITAFILLATLNDISVGVKSSSNFASTINSFINSLLIFFNPLSTTYLNSKSFISILSAILPIATKSI